MGSASRFDVKYRKGPAKENGGPVFIDDTRWAEIVGSRVCIHSSQQLGALGKEGEGEPGSEVKLAPALLDYDAHKLENVTGNENKPMLVF